MSDQSLIGPELDAEVQRQIFGHHIPEDWQERLAVPPCSTKIGHSWTVVDKVREWGFYLSEMNEDMHCGRGFDGERRWRAVFNGPINDDGEDCDFGAVGPTPEVALCRAGLAVAEFWNAEQQPVPVAAGGE
jgi:hypothetical protein